MQTTQAPKELEVFGQLQRNLGEATMQLVATAVRTPWKELSLEMRTSPDGTSRGMRLRVTPVSGALLAVRPTRAVEVALHNICEMRSTFTAPWYGMKLTITIQGQCKVEFNYEPECKKDPAFRDSQEF
jgi:hypothetical protein